LKTTPIEPNSGTAGQRRISFNFAHFTGILFSFDTGLAILLLGPVVTSGCNRTIHGDKQEVCLKK
ncbi:MAG: hypothetical protein KJ052_20690, partial [Candidatus Hydrogenedentes bacterium]|nr:hypothetical protein [Candidatus Hydrogenedentota bacterium]